MTHPHLCTAAVALLTTLAAAPRTARALEVGLELELGTSIPLGAFPDGVPASIDDPSGALFEHIPQSAYNVLLDYKPVAGFSGGLSLLLGHWYLRAAVAVNSYSSAKLTRYALRRVNGQDLPEEVHNLYFGRADIQRDLPSQTIVAARFGFGYRWYLLPEGPARPYIPLGLGMAVAHIEGGTHFGVTFHGGLGVDIHLHERFDIGVRLLYEWIGIGLPSQFQASSAATAIGTAASSGNSVLEAFLESLHTIQLAVTSTVRF